MKKHNVKRHEVVQPLDTSYRYIPLTRGLNAVVDAEDFEHLSQWNWHALKSSKSNTLYAIRKHGVLMHRVLMKCEEYEQIDHKDGDGLNNRKANLRKCDKYQNQHNRGLVCTNTTGYIGVTRNYYPRKDGIQTLYRAQIHIDGRQVTVCYSRDAETAARAYDKAARERGEFARLNFP